ncbi:MAG: acyl carrier protein [Cellulosilyticaceae bacterium]
MDIKQWIIAWMLENVGMEEQELKEHTQDNYFDMGWLDSYTFVGFITDLEKQLNKKFTNGELTKKEFRTIDGLIKIISGGGDL